MFLYVKEVGILERIRGGTYMAGKPRGEVGLEACAVSVLKGRRGGGKSVEARYRGDKEASAFPPG